MLQFLKMFEVGLLFRFRDLLLFGVGWKTLLGVRGVEAGEPENSEGKVR